MIQQTKNCKNFVVMNMRKRMKMLGDEKKKMKNV